MSQQLRDQLQATLSGSYTLERELGGGGMSRVFVAEELRLKRKVVVKVLSPEMAQGISVERFEREIRTVAALQQANIVPVHTAGDTNGLPYYTMPFVEGESLRARLTRGPLAVTEVIGVLRDVTRALAYAHEHGVVHRDIKPDNVLMSGGAAVVTDFGIAKAISAARTSAGSATLTQVGTSIGTPAYMAPEQAAGDPHIDHRADIYSLGAMAYELLAGQVVFAGRTPQRMLAAHMGEAPKPISEFRGDLPAALADLVMQCLAKEASARPQSAGEIARVLDTITSGSGMQAMPPVLMGGPGMFRRVLAIYAAAFVAVAILAKAAIVGIGLPDWVFPGSLIVMALTLPLVLWTGYVHRVAHRAMTMTPTFTPGGTPSVTHGTIATMALKAAPKMSWYRTTRGVGYALGTFVVAIAVFMALRALGIGPAATLISSGRLGQRDLVLLTDFRITNADSSLGRVVSDAVRQGLSESSALTLVSPSAVSAALTRMRRPASARIDLALARELATREGVKAIIDGDVAAVGGSYILTLRLVPPDSGNPLASISAAGDGPKGLIDAADKASRDLRARVGESLRRVHNTAPLAQVTTSSLEALRKYSEAYRENSVNRDFTRAIALAREAVALDSTFAMAWRLLAAAMSNATFPAARIDSAYRQAFRYQDRMSDRERAFMLEGYYRNGPGHDRQKALAAAERMMALGDTFAAANNMAVSLNTRREFARGESLLVLSMRADSTSQLPHSSYAATLANLGRSADAESAAALYNRRFPGSNLALQLALIVQWTKGKSAEFRHALDSLTASSNPQTRAWAFYRKGELALLDGKPADFQRLYAQGRTIDVARGVARVALDDSAFVVRVDAVVRGSSARAASRMDAALAAVPLRSVDPRDRPYFGLVRAYAEAGRPDKARAVLSQYSSEVTDTSLRRAQQPAYHTALGDIALAEKRYPEAITEFRRGDSLPDGPATACTTCLWGDLARVFDAAGQRDSAILMYERYITTPYAARFNVAQDPLLLPGTVRRLAELHEDKGDVAKAADYYRRFIELRKNADLELQPQVAEARRRLARLAPVEKPR